MRDEIQQAEEPKTRMNSLEDVAAGLFPGGAFQSQTIAQPWTFIEGMSFSLVTLNRMALSQGYVAYGLVQTVIDQPVEDAFRGGVEIESAELDEEDLKLLHKTMEEKGDYDAIKATAKWARLFGGSGLIVVTEQDPATPLRPEAIAEGSELCFVAADRWELILSALSISGNQYGVVGWQQNPDAPYNYYGVKLDASRVVKMLGREAPSFVRQRLQGWGMSELERCMREINSFLKFQNLLFELVDEAKVDVYRIEQFNDTLATAQGSALITARIQLANLIKNYKNALVMDSKDEFDQKQIAFGGLADIFEEFRINLAASLKIPLNKLFGQSATGFSSGEDSMENYNSMVESDVREKVKPLVREALKLRMQQVFGFVPEFSFAFKPLRVLNEIEEETVKSAKQTRTLELFDRDLLDGQESMESLHKDGLVNVDSAVLDGTRAPISPLALQAEQTEQSGKVADATAKAKTKKENARGYERLAALLERRGRRAA